jgi:hypothetical protein
MSKNLITFFSVFILLYSLPSTAQPIIGFGLKAGGNLATVTGSDVGDVSLLPGGYAGGIARFSWSNDRGIVSFVIQPELFYSMQGAKYQGSLKNRISYLNFATVVQRHIASSSFYIETGPQVGFLLSAKIKSSGGASSDIKDELKPIDFSILAGAGYKFLNGIGIHARYALGITSIDKEGFDVHNAVISAGLFYVFGGRGED